MADILRQPLVSQRQPKRPIAPVDYFSRPLTLGINPNARIAQLSDSAPQRHRRIHLDVYPNLLGTTLASGAPATLDLPLRSGRVFESAPRKRWQADPLQSQGLIVYDGPEAAIASLTDSAPQRRKALSLEQVVNLLTNTLGQAPGLGLPLFAERLDDSAPARKAQVRVEALHRPLALGINPNAAVAQLSDSAPPAKKSAYSFDFPNLLGSTLQAAQAQLSLPLSAMRIDASAPAVKFQVRIEPLYRPLTLGINPNAGVVQLGDSAPERAKAAYAFDPPNLLVGTLADPIGLPLTAGRVDASAPILKYQVRVESLDRPITLGVNPNAVIAQLSTSAPPPKRAAYTFDPPNLICGTLAEQLDLPRRSGRIDWSAPPPKKQAYLDSPLNTLVIAPAPSVPISGIRVVVVKPNNRRIRVQPNNRRIRPKGAT